MLCPECRNETHSKNKGLIRHRTCRSCGHEFTTIETIHEPEMSTKEKLEKFMCERKRPTTTAVLAAYFMVSSNTINRLMKDLEDAGKVTRAKLSGGKNQWAWNYEFVIPPKHIQIRPKEPAPIIGRPITHTSSYPNIRGYDD